MVAKGLVQVVDRRASPSQLGDVLLGGMTPEKGACEQLVECFGQIGATMRSREEEGALDHGDDLVEFGVQVPLDEGLLEYQASHGMDDENNGNLTKSFRGVFAVFHAKQEIGRKIADGRRCLLLL